MTPFERLAAVYFLILLAAARQTPRPWRGLLYASGAIALVIVASLALPWAARAWLAHAYLILGYWIPAAFVPPTPNRRFERWLASADTRINSQLPIPNSQTPRLGVGGWKLGVGVLELAYLACYPLVPAAFAVVYANGSEADVEWFWLAVLTAGYGCYITLSWTAARPPRLMDAQRLGLPHPVAAVNAAVLGRMSHQLVTFPSGHVAVSVAAALSAWRVCPGAGAAFGAIAMLIAVAAVAGRYHYLVDVLLGLLLGALAPVLVATFAGS